MSAREWIDVADPRLDELARLLAARPRVWGFYILRVLDISARLEEPRMLDAVYRHIADGHWPHDDDDFPWATAAVSAKKAKEELVDALVGGGSIGHAVLTMTAAMAEQRWALFESLFALERRYYINLAIGDAAYVFHRGVAIVDATRAGFLGIVEND